MSNSYNNTNHTIYGHKTDLKSLSRNLLIENLKGMIKQEKALTLQIIDSLQEVENRKLHLDMGYTNMFVFLTEELGYCHGTAHLRLQAMRALKTVPEMRAQVLNNKMGLTTLAKTQSFIFNEDKKRKELGAAPMTLDSKKELFQTAVGVSSPKVEEVLQIQMQKIENKEAEVKGLPPSPPKPILKKITFEADPELLTLITELTELVSHQTQSSDLGKVLKIALPLAIQELKIKRGLLMRKEIRDTVVNRAENESNPSMTQLDAVKGINENMKKVSQNMSASTNISEKHSISKNQTFIDFEAPGSSMNQRDLRMDQSKGAQKKLLSKNKLTRHIPSSIKRAVWKRDQGQCQARDPSTQKICGSRWKVQLDHVKPWCIGGEHSLENLQCVCDQHNRYRYERYVNLNR